MTAAGDALREREDGLTLRSAAPARRRGARHRHAGRDGCRLGHHGRHADGGRSACAARQHARRPAPSWWCWSLSSGRSPARISIRRSSLVFAMPGSLAERDCRSISPHKSSAASPARSRRMPCLPCRSSKCRAQMRTGGAQWFSEGVATFGLVADHPRRPRASSGPPCPGWSGSTSPPPTGSRPRPRLPIRPSLWPAR